MPEILTGVDDPEPLPGAVIYPFPGRGSWEPIKLPKGSLWSPMAIAEGLLSVQEEMIQRDEMVYERPKLVWDRDAALNAVSELSRRQKVATYFKQLLI